MEVRSVLGLSLLLAVLVAGCTQTSPDSGAEPARIPSADVTVEAEVVHVETHNVTETTAAGEQTVAPDDAVRLRIQDIRSVDNPANVSYSLTEGDTITIGARYGARPAAIMQIPAEQTGDGPGATVSHAQWTEWEDGRFVFKKKSETYDTEDVVETFDGMAEGDRIRTTLTFVSGQGLADLGSYDVVG